MFFAAVTLAAESLKNGIKHNPHEDVRPQRIKNHAAECADEEPGSTVCFRVRVKVKVKHQDLVISTAPSTPTPIAESHRSRCRGRRGSMAAIVFARDLLFHRSQILFPSRGFLNIDQDFSTHKLQDLHG